ncbi:MAG TPA: hypothetical protein VGH67_15745 [Solirubrobacteraceae bacterium]
MPQEFRDLEPLRRMSERIRGGDTPPQTEIEQALEAGFGRLIGLEAELGRARPAQAPGPMGAVAEELLREICELRDALTELRTLSGPPGPSRIGYGFVLPGKEQTRRFDPSRRTPGWPRRS